MAGGTRKFECLVAYQTGTRRLFNIDLKTLVLLTPRFGAQTLSSSLVPRTSSRFSRIQ